MDLGFLCRVIDVRHHYEPDIEPLRLAVLREALEYENSLTRYVRNYCTRGVPYVITEVDSQGHSKGIRSLAVESQVVYASSSYQ